MEELNDKIDFIQINALRSDKISKTFEWEIKYIQDNEKDWRDIMKAKNEKILELTELLEKNKREHSIQEMKYIKEIHYKDEEIARLNVRIFELEAELHRNTSSKYLDPNRYSKPDDSYSYLKHSNTSSKSELPNY